jgi:hypothetical protein
MKLSESKDVRTTWSYFREKDHPIWGITKTLISAGLVAVYLSFNATSFDSGEVRVVVLSWLSSLVMEGVNITRKTRA